MYRFLLSRRWLAFVVVVLALAGVAIRLGLWQWHRMDDREIRNAIITAHLAADPVPLDAAAPVGHRVTESDEWLPVTVSGRWDVAHEVTVKFQTREGRRGYEIVTPLRLADGTAILVDRGWAAWPDGSRPTVEPRAQGGEVSIVGRLRPDNDAGPQATRPSDGQVRAISSSAIGAEFDVELRSGWLDLVEESPEPAATAEPRPEPDLSQGPHFFYALQWWFFALLALVGYVWFAIVERQANETKSA